MSFTDAAEEVIHYIDDRYGRAAAWLVGILLTALPIALFLGAIWWTVA